MKTFKVQIRAYGYHAIFNISCEDNAKSFEDTLVDKLGKNDIVWDKDGFTSKSKTWLTYEEVINEHVQNLYTKKRSLELKWSQHYNQEKRYTLDMVRIDDKIRQVINHIKQAEAKEAHLVNKSRSC